MKVIVFSGHMIDQPDRPVERFPPRKEAAVREKLAAKLDEWQTGQGDIAICGGARGGDILFAELCDERGANVKLLLALPDHEFIERSVSLPHSNWELRFNSLLDRCDIHYQHNELGPPPANTNVFERNNLWCLETARTYSTKSDCYGLMVWDEKPTGDGRGGTSHFVATVKQLAWEIHIINPTTLN